MHQTAAASVFPGFEGVVPQQQRTLTLLEENTNHPLLRNDTQRDPQAVHEAQAQHRSLFNLHSLTGASNASDKTA